MTTEIDETARNGDKVNGSGLSLNGTGMRSYNTFEDEFRTKPDPPPAVSPS